MAPTETIMLRAKAKQLNIPNYKAMSLSELDAAVKAASKNGADTAVDNGASAKSTGTKRKSASKRKPAPQPAPEAEIKKAPAKKRKSAGRKKTGTAKSAPAKSTKRKPAQRKSAAANRGTAKRQTTGKRKTTTARKRTPVANADYGRQMIEAGDIDWTAESSVGADPDSKRGIVMKMLRQKKGNVQKVYDALESRAKELFGKTDDGRKRTKDEALTLLRWYIGSTRYAFVKSTDQHPEADNPNYRKAARKRVSAMHGTGKRAGASRKAKTASTGRKPARKRATAQRPAQKRKRGTVKRASAKRATTSRKAKTASALKRGH